MREIVHVQIGQCGNGIGAKFWEVIADEHGLTPDGIFQGESDLQSQRLNVYFVEGRDKKYVPRAILVDLDPSSVNNVLSGAWGKMFKPDNVAVGKAGTGNNWARGYYTEGAELVSIALDLIRTEAEACDLIQGIQLVHSLGGGSGGGMTSLLMTKLKEEYPETIIKSYCVIPYSSMPTVVVEPYNAILTLVKAIDCTDQTFCVDNQAMHHICTNVLKLTTPTFTDTNRLISNYMSGITTCFRFPGQLNTDLRKLLVNLVPFPRLHFFIPGYAPLYSRSSAPYIKVDVPELTKQLFHANSMFVYCDPTKAKFLTVAVIFRGRMSTKFVDEQMLNIRSKNSPHFIEWIPNNIQTAICDIPPRGINMSASMISNSTAIQRPIKRLMSAFDNMLKKRAYLHWYTNEGMDESEFTESYSTMYNLLFEYQQHQEAVADTDIFDESMEYDEEE
ncbi:tubulin beta-1 chain-like [Apis laboriosa]|uniref:tubulin beta-1 chain-like n=1 Tax=Apis laboriosa TaxID=183418 RepID=UPI001CC7E8A3|nr:tubulin beta-1 chain-like [Apis laboriosa]